MAIVRTQRTYYEILNGNGEHPKIDLHHRVGHEYHRRHGDETDSVVEVPRSRHYLWNVLSACVGSTKSGNLSIQEQCLRINVVLQHLDSMWRIDCRKRLLSAEKAGGMWSIDREAVFGRRKSNIQMFCWAWQELFDSKNIHEILEELNTVWVKKYYEVYLRWCDDCLLEYKYKRR